MPVNEREEQLQTVMRIFNHVARLFPPFEERSEDVERVEDWSECGFPAFEARSLVRQFYLGQVGWLFESAASHTLESAEFHHRIGIILQSET